MPTVIFTPSKTYQKGSSIFNKLFFPVHTAVVASRYLPLDVVLPSGSCMVIFTPRKFWHGQKNPETEISLVQFQTKMDSIPKSTAGTKKPSQNGFFDFLRPGSPKNGFFQSYQWSVGYNLLKNGYSLGFFDPLIRSPLIRNFLWDIQRRQSLVDLDWGWGVYLENIGFLLMGITSNGCFPVVLFTWMIEVDVRPSTGVAICSCNWDDGWFSFFHKNPPNPTFPLQIAGLFII